MTKKRRQKEENVAEESRKVLIFSDECVFSCQVGSASVGEAAPLAT